MRTCSPAKRFHDGRSCCIFLLVACVAVLSQLPYPALAQADTLSSDNRSVGHSVRRSTSEHTYLFATGAANILDTYLSAEKYKGTELRYITTVSRQTRWYGVRQTILNEGQLDYVSNRADNNNELGGMYRFQYHLRRHWELAQGLAIEAGGGIGANVGFLYNTRNSNNPAQAYAALQLLPSAAASQQARLFNWPVLLRYEASVPLLGVMFSPNYGQSYYEIFSRGNYDHNVVPTTIAATPSLRHMLTADVPLSRRKQTTTLCIGYLGDYQQAKVNNLKQHQYAHMLVIGLRVTK